MKSQPDQRRAWFDVERFRNVRAFGQGGCVLPLLIVIAAPLALAWLAS